MKSYSPFQLAFILKHALSNEIWIINTQGEIQCLKTPFKVIVIKEIGLLTIDSIVQVTEVKVTQELITIFRIHNKYYYYSYFKIILK